MGAINWSRPKPGASLYSLLVKGPQAYEMGVIDALCYRMRQCSSHRRNYPNEFWLPIHVINQLYQHSASSKVFTRGNADLLLNVPS